MCSLMHVKAIGTKKSEILAKITFLGIFGQILPKAPIVQGLGSQNGVLNFRQLYNTLSQINQAAFGLKLVFCLVI